MKRTLSYAARLVFLFSCIQFTANATHIMGGELTYIWMGGNTYQFTFTFYRDCSGISANDDLPLDCRAQSCGYSFMDTLFLLSGPENISPICSNYMNQTTCDGGTFFGFEKYTYQKQITLPGACHDWVFGVPYCCRNTAITNLFDPSNHYMWVEARLDNISTPFNNSPQFTNPPASILMLDQTYHISNGAYDPDHDSLVISLAQPEDSSNFFVPYNPPYTIANPMSSSPPLSFNNTTGELTVTPDALQIAVISYLIEEYRNGTLIGSVTRDVELIVINETDQIPTLTGIDSTNNFVALSCPGDSLSFNIYSNDLDSGQVLTMSWDSSIANGNFSSTNDPHPVGSFSWVPDSSDVSGAPHVFTVTVKDDACPYNGVQNYSFIVYVNQCNTDNVWPGDADADYGVNLYDILPIGLLFNESGTTRPVASLDWMAQPCPDWTQAQPSGVNAKHADCDGSGTIDAVDFDAITLNYGYNHYRPIHPSRNPSPFAAPSLYMQFAGETIPSDADVSVPLMLGDGLQNASDVYGLVFSLSFDASLIVPGSLSFDANNSWLGNATNLTSVTHEESGSGSFDIGLVRLDQMNISGNGLIGTLHFKTVSVVTDQQLTFTFSGVRMIDNLDHIKPVTTTPASVIIEAPNGINDVTISNSFLIFPNPASDFITLTCAEKIPSATMSIQNLLGGEIMKREIKFTGTHAITLDVSFLPGGSYLCILKSEKGNSVLKFIRQ